LAHWQKQLEMATAPMISIVDDDDSVRESVKSLLRSVGYRAEVFASAEEFLDSNHIATADCLILDVRMPGISGLDLQRRLVSCHWRVPIVFITAHDDDEARVRALQDGAVQFLFKPFSEEALLTAVQSALNI
jgi:FixJ family two-component response regulator